VYRILSTHRMTGQYRLVYRILSTHRMTGTVQTGVQDTLYPQDNRYSTD
jgi:hypothetical protein